MYSYKFPRKKMYRLKFTTIFFFLFCFAEILSRARLNREWLDGDFFRGYRARSYTTIYYYTHMMCTRAHILYTRMHSARTPKYLEKIK